MADRSPVREARTLVAMRALQLGDLLCSTPALRTLRRALPEAHIALIGLPWARELVARLDSVDELIEFPGYPGIPEVPADPSVLPSFFALMQARSFDLALQLHGSGNVSNGFVALLGARRSAGFELPGVASRLDETVAYPDDQPEERRPLVLLRRLGFETTDEQLEFPLRDADRAELAPLAARHGLVAGGYVCLHPGARDPRRRWNAPGWARLADHLADRGYRVVLTGTAAEAPITAEIRARMRYPAVDLAGATSLGALAALVAGARLLVSCDTGVSHLADALRVPSVVLFTGSDPQRWAPLDRELHRVVAARRVAGDATNCCLGEACPHTTSGWEPLDPDEALLAIEEQLDGGARRAA
jgi:ADP-heptose:LPS heptosyltransferase